jgi:sterol desaturase/sphingolipid hydroxylase (fatty acid hydroxylase superfamily)
MPTLRTLLAFLAYIALMVLLMRMEFLLIRDSSARRAAVFAPEKILEYKLVGLFSLLRELIDSVASGIRAAEIALINSLGGGLIHLSASGWWFVPSIILYVMAFDLYSYFMHRLQHKVPALWAMHSLHHSAQALSVTTGARHFWFESVVGLFLFAPLGFLFVVPINILLWVAILNGATGAITHFDLRIPMGKFLWFNNPHWHRIHHSTLPQHRDKNFANMFPIFDVIFGTAWIPAADEFPLSGLDTGDKPATVFEGMLWPLRHLWRPSANVPIPETEAAGTQLQ